MKIATWNVNSLRVRLPQVMKWLEETSPDILGLQETKLQDPDFPVDEFRSAGYHVAFAGQKTYNGVALLSRQHQAGPGLLGRITTLPFTWHTPRSIPWLREQPVTAEGPSS